MHYLYDCPASKDAGALMKNVESKNVVSETGLHNCDKQGFILLLILQLYKMKANLHATFF